MSTPTDDENMEATPAPIQMTWFAYWLNTLGAVALGALLQRIFS